MASPTTVFVNKDQYLIREGEESNEVYIVEEGSLGVFKVKNSQEVKIGTIFEGELVGEMSFFDNSPRCATIKALTDSRLLVIPSSKFEMYVNKQPKWFRTLLETLIDRIRKASNRVKPEV
ncbi:MULTISPECIES: Crp/Fnr family transcriptional regulator [Halobacteriovorax]|uniref:Cyclic nucleotide-binding domain-containing protein n=1 Tax=Halobacteriovorax vibrionivorans TaxID=2152716 RepID=A0ABY0ICS4_9BACT|nr:MULTISPECIES: cyclic nucleotide-binding domain-containing protein [Halobacteriovorax]AYF44674.1 cyclic nucleotide-binding domain protein [Halobacteriovorax sp. BALOs_7]RZF20759.1 cyclic nucleotide-binding domain-containing protein [Halobacteriovorax vibrionivorans]TGD46515.1 cyclic nucleotide-binding domain-containing protein [Halobacteriovorax sp. Y22]